MQVPVYERPLMYSGETEMNPGRVRAWKEGAGCPWQREGVWEVGSDGQPRLLRPAHFARRPDGAPVDFARDYMAPFFRSFAGGRAAHPHAAPDRAAAMRRPGPRPGRAQR